MMLFSLVYVSSATGSFRPGDLKRILEISRRNNAAVGITGLLLHVGGNFMQALEGEAHAVQALYGRIALDPRHGRLQTILARPIEDRAFPDWSMAFREAGELDPTQRDGVSSFLRDALRGQEGNRAARGSTAVRLLEGFARTMR
jgi:hypothetical protein